MGKNEKVKQVVYKVWEGSVKTAPLFLSENGIEKYSVNDLAVDSKPKRKDRIMEMCITGYCVMDNSI